MQVLGVIGSRKVVTIIMIAGDNTLIRLSEHAHQLPALSGIVENGGVLLICWMFRTRELILCSPTTKSAIKEQKVETFPERLTKEDKQAQSSPIGLDSVLVTDF